MPQDVQVPARDPLGGLIAWRDRIVADGESAAAGLSEELLSRAIASGSATGHWNGDLIRRLAWRRSPELGPYADRVAAILNWNSDPGAGGQAAGGGPAPRSAVSDPGAPGRGAPPAVQATLPTVPTPARHGASPHVVDVPWDASSDATRPAATGSQTPADRPPTPARSSPFDPLARLRELAASAGAEGLSASRQATDVPAPAPATPSWGTPPASSTATSAAPSPAPTRASAASPSAPARGVRTGSSPVSAPEPSTPGGAPPGAPTAAAPSASSPLAPAPASSPPAPPSVSSSAATRASSARPQSPSVPVPTPAASPVPPPAVVAPADPMGPPTSARPRPAVPASPPASPAETEGEETGPGYPPEAFAPYAFPLTEGDPPVQEVQVQVAPDRLRYAWPPVDPAAGRGRVVIYRVVTDDGEEPYSPDEFHHVTGTLRTRAADSAELTAAVRYVTVWAYTGDDLADAAGSQPFLHARQAVVAPVFDCHFREEAGVVTATWSVRPGVRAVRVLRIPAAQARRAGIDWEDRILADQPNLAGFVDTGVEVGRHYVYRMLTEAPVADGIALSSVVSQSIKPSVPLRPVTDLQVVLHDDGARATFDLSWTPPVGGQVALFRTERGPVGGAENEAIGEDALPQTGLGPDERIAHPVETLPDGRATVRAVAWPEGWPRAHFTAVTLLDGRARVGATEVAVRVNRVEGPRLIERVDWRSVTFAWPEGAGSVYVYARPARAPLEDGDRGTPYAVVDQKSYSMVGGVRFGNGLPAHGASLYLVSAAFRDGVPVFGPPVHVPYVGMWRMRYEIEYLGMTRSKARIVLFSELETARTLPFALVHRPDRLPLDPDDGERVPMAVEGSPEPPRTSLLPPRLGNRDGDVLGVAQLGRQLRRGWLRLFVDTHDLQILPHVALSNPPLRELRP